MKQTIPFKKDITFKTKIGELTSIALDNDLVLKGEDLIIGNFYISGTYKMLESSALEEDYSYKIPCEIAISDEYDTYNAEIDIDDFYYEIINDEILRINIVVVINNLEKKEKNENSSEVEILNVYENELEEIRKEEKIRPVKEEKYLTYKIYIYKEEDTIADILEKYNITLEQLNDYNNVDEIKNGSKIIIPSFND